MTEPTTPAADLVAAYRSPGTRTLYCVICARQEPEWRPITASEMQDETACDFCGGRILVIAAQTLGQVIARYIPEHDDQSEAPTALSPEREAEIRETHPGEWYEGPWAQDYVDSNGDEPAYCRVVHQESGTVLATLPDFAGPIALFIADAHDAVPELLAELDRIRTWHENYKAGTRMAGGELRKRLADVETERDELKEKLLTAQGNVAREAARAEQAESRLETVRQSARREEMTRQKRDAQIIILGDQLKKRGVTNAEISEWIESVS
ncbi:hypothetical protein [Streptomyces hygroscopicus]|uniref:hypothetical protein n=1 Tax=Streptomyces hygroscopicus TaxID=1912 RepID=UPI0034065C92